MMICYRDRTFCPFWVECQDGDSCNRALTDSIRDGANKAKLLIAEYMDKPDCFVDKNEGNDLFWSSR